MDVRKHILHTNFRNV